MLDYGLGYRMSHQIEESSRQNRCHSEGMIGLLDLFDEFEDRTSSVTIIQTTKTITNQLIYKLIGINYYS